MKKVILLLETKKKYTINTDTEKNICQKCDNIWFRIWSQFTDTISKTQFDSELLINA